MSSSFLSFYPFFLPFNFTAEVMILRRKNYGEISNIYISRRGALYGVLCTTALNEKIIVCLYTIEN